MYQDPLEVAQSRVFAATCLLCGSSAIVVSAFAVLNHEISLLLPLLGTVGGLLCVAAPFLRSRLPVGDRAFLITFASVAGALLVLSMIKVEMLFSTPSLFLLVAVSAVTLVGGRTAGIIAVAIAIVCYALSYGLYHDALPIEGKEGGGMIDWRIAAASKVVAALFFFLSADVFRSGMTKAALTLREAKRTADAANDMKSTFLANMSHEVRTPLNGILGMAQALREQPLDPQHKAQIEIINRSGELLLRVLDDVLDIAKIEANKLEIEERTFDLFGAAEQVVNLYRAAAEAKGLRLSLFCEKGTAPLRRGDEHRIMQVIGNVLSNCVKFTPEGAIDVAVSGSPEAVEIAVSDTGIGMSPGQCEKITEPFTQADSSTTRRFGGTGLGLSIVVRLIDLMGGQLSIESEEGVGSTFRIVLPLPSIERAVPSGKTVVPEVRRIDLDLSGLRILVVDDEPTNRMIIETFLLPTAASVVEAADGLDAVSAYAAEPFDLILMDISMPTMGGVEAMKRIRATKTEWPCPPICAVTAHAGAEQLKEFIQAGFDTCLTKPVRLPELAALLRDQLPVVGATEDNAYVKCRDGQLSQA